MRVLIISDLHYDHKICKSVDESKAWSWLMSIVDHHKPDLLLSCGDWGTAITHEKFYDLLGKCVVLTIYGNHENVNVLKSLYNVKTNEHLPVLMKDGEIYEFDGLKIAGINGIISERKKSRKGVPRKRPEEYLKVANTLASKNIDILLIHEVPLILPLFNITDTTSSRVTLEAIKIIRPKLVVNGHMHARFKYYEFSFNTRYVNIDSSQASRYYVIIKVNGHKKIEVWKDYEIREVLGS